MCLILQISELSSKEDAWISKVKHFIIMTIFGGSILCLCTRLQRENARLLAVTEEHKHLNEAFRSQTVQ